MRKIICMLLLVSSLLAICSCATIKDKYNEITGKDTLDISAFESAIAATNASSVVIEVSTDTDLGVLKSKFEVNYVADGSATINYSYEKFNEIGVGADDEVKSTVKGTIYRSADGTYSEDIGVDLSAVSAAACLDLTSVKDSAKINDGGDVLTVVVPASKTADVLGSPLSYDVNLDLTIRDGVVKTVKLTYQGGSAYYQYN